MTAAGELPAEEYAGPAVVSTGGAPEDGPAPGGLEVRVRLRGHFEPLDGRFHWYGRIGVHPELAERHPSGSEVVLTTPRGRAVGRLSDEDPWGRFRISGTGRPPF